MQVLGISSSPRKDGNSDVAAKTILQVLRGLGQTEFVRIADYHVKHCLGCGRCRQLRRCVIEDDDLHRLVDKWRAADWLVVCSPVYWSSPPGVMKNFIDRTVSFYAHPAPLFEDKKVVLATIAAENGFELHNELLSGWLRCYGAHIVGSIDLYAWEKNDLAQDSSQIARLEGLAAGIMRIALS